VAHEEDKKLPERRLVILKKAEARRRKFSVLCAWCGSKIRETKQPHDNAECLSCFYQSLSKHLASQKRTPSGEFVSER